ncbi:hypothetical protein FOE78_02790 [Microlunatus elymi]|uniref:Pyruvate, water dikinase n=1 Tax=Microlunatus elymi TaxID=2596828 RepID=A0A516PUW3_9ACTN|nr:PEP/pyruvate-binding domain-containing protein [Microlunatus elymi]QDP94985.1 hypothetical protein FOE78_02790 [Microlunatus elymi]
MSGYTIDLHGRDVPEDERQDGGAPSARDVELIGGKGLGLTALTAAGFPVPNGFVITTDAYREVVAAAGLTAADPAEMRAQLPTIAISAPITEQILTGYARLKAAAVAVRSSATAEDLAGASFAGQYDSYLSLSTGQEVLDAVRNCWASLWTPRAVDYRAQHGADDRRLAMAVVVQAMVPAQWAGVLFTADPVSGRRDRIVLEAVAGLGEALVSGTATGEHVDLDKTTLAVRGEPGPGAAVVRELAELGLRVEQEFGGPQDLEWAYADGKIWLLQARPLTALRAEPASGRSSRRRGRRDRQSRPSPFAVTADHMPQPPYPMDLALFVRPVLRAVLGAIASTGLTTPPLDEVLVEIDDGVVQVIPPKIGFDRRALLGVPAALPKVVGLLRTRTDVWRARSAETLLPLARRLDTEDLDRLSDAELLDRVGELFGTAGRLSPSRFGAVPIGAAAEQVAALLLRPLVGTPRAKRLRADLMADLDCVTSRANADLARLTRTVRDAPELLAAYREREPEELGERLAGSESGRQLLLQVDRYLADYGYRELALLTVGQPSLRERPEVVHTLIKGQLERGDDQAPRDRAIRARAELAAEPGLIVGALRPVLGKLFDTARDRTAFREDSDYQLAMVPSVARRLLLELGRRMVRRGALADPNDIAFLEPDELDLPTDRTQELVARRKQAREAALPGYSIIPAHLLGSAAAGQVRGTPASPGSYVGIVRVVHDETEFATLRAGEVLVCPYTNPLWTPLFGLAGAVVVDSGGAASHAAIVAREYGIPAVMGTQNATRELIDGQRVLVDADRGTVTTVGSSRTTRTPVGR